MIMIITWHRKKHLQSMPKSKRFSGNTAQWLLSMGNQVVTKADFAKLCFSLLGMSVLPKNLFVSNLKSLFGVFNVHTLP